MSKVRLTYKGTNTTINLVGRITCNTLYGSFLTHLMKYIKENKNNPPIISIEKVSWIESSALPIMIGIGLVLKDYYTQPIELLMAYNPSLLQYLQTSRFLNIVGKYGYDIFRYDSDLIGGFESYVDPFNPEYKIWKNAYYTGYYDLQEDEQRMKKYQLQDDLINYEVPDQVGNLLRKVTKTSDQYNQYIECISEIESNAILYSYSDSYICTQANKAGVFISLCDIGIGFEKSLKLKGVKTDSIKEYVDKDAKILLDSNIFSEFFSLFQALKTAEEAERMNLWGLKKAVTKNKGTFRIHTKHILIDFSDEFCNREGCEKEGCKKPENVVNCMNCILKNYSTDWNSSPLMVFRGSLRGVHIDIRFYKEKEK